MDGAHGGTGWNENRQPPRKKNTQITQNFSLHHEEVDGNS